MRAHTGVWEVILTGGDPLTLAPRRIAETTQALAANSDHVKTMRWHTRLPVAAPERVTKAMARALMAQGKTTAVAVHANHPRELTESARSACRRLAAHGAMLVSQSVLLKGVNDDAETLIALMRAFVEAGVKPYYLHHGDLAPGTAHWRVPIAKGQELMRLLRARLSGLATPSYMLDIPGGRGKVPIGPQWIRTDGGGTHVVTDPRGGEHRLCRSAIGRRADSVRARDPSVPALPRRAAAPGLVGSMADDFHQRRAGACRHALDHVRLGNRVKDCEPDRVGQQHGQQGRGLDGRDDRQPAGGRQIAVAEVDRFLKFGHDTISSICDDAHGAMSSTTTHLPRAPRLDLRVLPCELRGLTNHSAPPGAVTRVTLRNCSAVRRPTAER